MGRKKRAENMSSAIGLEVMEKCVEGNQRMAESWGIAGGTCLR